MLYPSSFLCQMVVKTFMDMDQDSEEEKELYLNLALHLASDFFLKHPDKDVRLLVACCLADIFRIYAPEAPYTSPDKLKVQNTAFICFSYSCLFHFLLHSSSLSPPVNDFTSLFTAHCFVLFPTPGYFHVYNTTAERTGGYEKRTVQPIFLPAGGKWLLV